jgi:membrane-associated phospholipid phosphatase
VDLPSAARIVDSALLSQVSDGSPRARQLGRAVSGAAQWGAGWHVLTAIMLVRPGAPRRVGIAGSTSWLAAQLITAALKPLIGRRRPSMPATGPGVASASMPSTHAASAAAYAASGLVQHRAAAALIIPAGGVAWSRLQTRRHYVSDVAAGVIAGSLIGATIGLGIRRLTRRRGGGFGGSSASPAAELSAPATTHDA